jgi:hypothetical protein
MFSAVAFVASGWTGTDTTAVLSEKVVSSKANQGYPASKNQAALVTGMTLRNMM